MTAKRSSTRIKPLRSVFPPDSEILFQANIVRLLVLYEDLRIELSCYQAQSIKHADVANDGEYRQRYFLRQSIRTLLEFSEAFRLLNSCNSIKYLLDHFDSAAQQSWQNGVVFFRNNERLFRDVRNDLGGHFGVEAAQFALETSTSRTTGKVEYSRDYASKGSQYIIHFVGEITARAFLRHLPGGNIDEKYRHLLERVRDGQIHGIEAVKDVIRCYLWPRFG